MTKAEMLKALQAVQVWNNSDIRGFEDISPNLDMLKARRKFIREAVAKLRAAGS